MFPVNITRIRSCLTTFSPKSLPYRRALAYSATDRGLSVQGTSFPYSWLRDSCACQSCVHPSTFHKIHKTSDISPDIRPKHDGVKSTDTGIVIEWANDGHQSFYPLSFLDRHSSQPKLSASHRDLHRILWDASSLPTATNLSLPYAEVQTPSGLLKAIDQLLQYGIVLVKGVPHTETSDEACELNKLARIFGDIRTTFYGDMWDVRNVRNSTNVAYTNLTLGLHMDLLYFESPPRFQILHCLRNRVVGGESRFVDAIQAATILRNTDPEAFEQLTSTPVAFHHIHAGHHLHYSHPTIELSNQPGISSNGLGSTPNETPIAYINYAPPFQAPLSLSINPDKFYPAFAQFSDLLAQPELNFEYLLKEGDAVFFDNRRILHSRAAFTDQAEVDEGETNRLLKGCYLEAEAVLDRGRILRTRKEQGLL